MKKLPIFILFFITTLSVFAQDNEDEYLVEDEEIEYDEEYEKNYQEFYNDTINYNKTLAYDTKRQFDEEPRSKYNGSEFNYTDNLKKEKKKEEKVEITKPSTESVDRYRKFDWYMSNIFPYVLGVLVAFILVKSFVKTDSSFWNFGKSNKKKKEKLIYEDDEDIDENDYERLLSKAIKEKNYRLATRYYYLSLLKKLSQKDHIKYHKDKTNTEYQFELDAKMRPKFSYLAYIYDYVWYGEFPVDETKFNSIEKKYKSFIQSI